MQFESFIYWGFQVCLIGLIGLVWKELKGMRGDIRQGQKVNNWLRHAVLSMHTRCAMIHPDRPMFPLGEDPDSRE